MNDDVALHPSTVAIHAGRGPRAPGAPLNPPLTLASSFHGGSYAREQGAPAWEAFEEAVGALDGGRSVSFASGIGASTAIIETLPAGAKVVGPAAGYAWTRGLLRERADSGRITLTSVDTSDTEATLEACEDADLLWLESPSNPMIEIAELDRICAALRDRDVLVAVDSSFATPLLQRPLALGADFSMHSATKFIGGHSDLLLGVVTTREDHLDAKLRHVRAQLGATPGAIESYLALRGLRTLPLRLDAAQRTALELAERLSAHPAVGKVHYPGLPGDPGHERARRFMDGFGAMLSIELPAGADFAESVCRGVRVFTHAKSLGGIESLIDRRARYTGSSAPESLLRLSIGGEHVTDLWNDLDNALTKEAE
ncbi:PLP-dependent aspartate aminotransferase family protein [Kibdelosporangium persicum]|uniref:Aminotransferase class I/II-fold pyridoxal phosphate-dependent enzyme n=1 Tax=Kibdelosporangium persicum TaxID=2698649 RepID=A0ABX2FIM0_9PSEU|nr:PLP-dependent transferase [Kibdelosporangium persicum]NRN71137.1 Aminotransferase class I/II-fold pyridoxal phosphate-dependent enzyme [Kibdelosporangium persicum]